jgi:hypothetical protein
VAWNGNATAGEALALPLLGSDSSGCRGAEG